MVLTLCLQNIAHKNEALHGYVSPRVQSRELYRLEIVLKIITVPSYLKFEHFKGFTLNLEVPHQKITLNINYIVLLL